jgi:hypothetical protein
MAAQQETPPSAHAHHLDAQMPREVGNFLIDTDDDECPDHSLHMAAFLGNVGEIELILSNPNTNHLLR